MLLRKSAENIKLNMKQQLNFIDGSNYMEKPEEVLLINQQE